MEHLTPDEQTHSWIIGILATAVAGLYGFFIKHTARHPDAEKMANDVKDLWDKKQDTKVCEKIVERIDQNQDEIKAQQRCIIEKIDRVIQWQENGGGHGRG